MNEILKKDLIALIITESQNDYLKWKRNNVTVRGIKKIGDENSVYGSFGKGLYTAPLSNKSMAREYGQLYYVVNAKPKNPKVVQYLNDAEMLKQKLVMNFCKEHGLDYNPRFFEEHTSMAEEMIKLGYDGLVIKGREMVNYSPENIKYYENERQLEQYYYTIVANNQNI